MQFNPKLSNIQSNILFKIKKLLKSEFVEKVCVGGARKENAIDLSDSGLKINGKDIYAVTEDYVYDQNNKKYSIEEWLKQDPRPINNYLDTFVI